MSKAEWRWINTGQLPPTPTSICWCEWKDIKGHCGIAYYAKGNGEKPWYDMEDMENRKWHSTDDVLCWAPMRRPELAFRDW